MQYEYVLALVLCNASRQYGMDRCIRCSTSTGTEFLEVFFFDDTGWVFVVLVLVCFIVIFVSDHLREDQNYSFTGDCDWSSTKCGNVLSR